MSEEEIQHNPAPESPAPLSWNTVPAGLAVYDAVYHESIEHRAEFWADQARRLEWGAGYETVVEEDVTTGKISWFTGGRLNSCRNALDRQVAAGQGSKRALVFFPVDAEPLTFTFADLLGRVTGLAGSLAAEGLGAGDRIALYLSDRPETVMFMLACARLGIIYVPIPVRFTSEAASEIIGDCGASLLVTALGPGNEAYDNRCRKVLDRTKGIRSVNVGDFTADGIVTLAEFARHGEAHPVEACPDFDSEHPIFIIYANSAAGVPRGSVYATGGFLVQASSSFDRIFRSNGAGAVSETVFSTVSLSSNGGQSYGLWGPFLNGCPVAIPAGGEETGPAGIRSVLDYCVSPALFTTPSFLSETKQAIGGAVLHESKCFSLVASTGDMLTPRVAGFAGETLTSGKERVLNLWIQSESGTALINTYPHPELNRPGALGLPFPGVEAKAVNTLGEPCRPHESGQLVFTSSWPAMIRTIWGQKDRYTDFYFHRIPGYFSTNDGVRVDSEGFFWFMGRLDDVIKVRGQSLASSEIEAVLNAHPSVKESAVVGYGEGNCELIAFIALDSERTDEEKTVLMHELTGTVAQRIGEFAVPGSFMFTDELPRTRTGKIVRRILRRVAAGDINPDEDMSHVANPEAIRKLMKK